MALSILNGKYMLRKVAGDLNTLVAILLNRGSPVHISVIKSKLGFVRNVSTIYLVAVEITYRWRLSNCFLMKVIDSFFYLDMPI